jgi:hypothetical protein
MKTLLRPAISLFVLLSLVTGVFYPLAGHRRRPDWLSRLPPTAA